MMVAIIPQNSASNRNANHKWKRGIPGGRALATLVAGTGIAVAFQPHIKKALRKRTNGKFRIHFSDVAIDCLCGAAGEVTALVALYPIDTLKVQCQARSASVGAALRFVLGQGTVNAARMLYAGVGSAAAGAAVVGALHLSLFYHWKRVAERSQGGEQSLDGPNNTASSVVGAVSSSLCVSFIDAPIDQMKLRSQASATTGSPIGNLIRTISQHGAQSVLNSSLVPFILKSIPHDLGELVTFSALNENKHVLTLLQPLPQSAADALMGAGAGVMAAVLSTPFDVINTKTNLQFVTQGIEKKVKMHDSLIAFARTAYSEVSKSGIRSVYVGFTPRLLQMVPAGIIYWGVVEFIRRQLESVNGSKHEFTFC